MNKKSVCFVAAKSGGHILPALTLAKKHKATHPETSIVCFTTDTQLDKQLSQDHSVIDEFIPLTLENVPRSIIKYPIFFYRVIKIFFSVRRFFKKNQPEKLVSLGGYISIPVCLAAYVRGIPIELYELNVIPGRANLCMAPAAQEIFICFGASAAYFKRPCTLTSYPLRFQDKIPSQQTALEELKLSSNRKTVTILGGSQGSLAINAAIKEWLIRNPALHACIQIIHQTGAQDSFDWNSFYASLSIPAVVVAFTKNLAPFYSASDLIVCRAGAGTLFEIQFFNKPCITLPLETASTCHQVENARAMMHQFPQLFSVIEQKQIQHDPEVFQAMLTQRLKMLQQETTHLRSVDLNPLQKLLQ